MTDGATATAADDCVFCAIVDRRAPARIVHETDGTLAFLDINPIVEGHSLVVPKAHAVDLPFPFPQRRAEAEELDALHRRLVGD